MSCPKCGSADGYIAHDYFAGWATFIGSWDVPDEECPTFTDDVIIRRTSKTAVCLDCGKRVTRPFSYKEI